MILVTGCPRSGTTPLGYIFDKYLDYSVLHEPFNYHTGIEQVNSYFQFKDVPNSTLNNELISLLIRLANDDVIVKDGIFPGDDLLRRCAKRVFGARTKRSLNNFKGLNRVVKDPFLSLSLKSATVFFDHVYITVRPPIGIMNSFKRYNWIFPEVFPHDGCEYLEGFSLSEYTMQPEFYALYIQYLIYNSFEDLKSDLFTVVDTSKLAGATEDDLKKVFNHLNLDSYASLKCNLDQMYESKSRGVFSGIHNHQRGKDALKASYKMVDVPKNCEALYKEVYRLYDLYAK
ncbi:hypothetical protein [Amphritea balenae]|uniref:Sulfotransferase domain-containing protein n=1 Tax=Amphritea balenae TaxID=452629 RepID=A0A3P1SSM1_9GAMM|nr:hypothetical protein [Amphritea balenae]RRD00182.1 hypothetical protein EHS89_08225 [Amphritea balenae]GGK77332.1 hypothetical protein GCM10007941_29350 [Amphritea balenae]